MPRPPPRYEAIRYCNVCNTHKPSDQFHRIYRDKPLPLTRLCKACQKAKRRQWYLANREEICAKQRLVNNHPDTRAAKKRRYHEDAEWREKENERNRLRRRTPTALAKQRAYERKRRKEDPNYRIAKRLRARVNDVLRGKKRGASTLVMLGCSLDYLRAHLESLWQPGMSWTNYGPKGWHIDHIIPCASFNMEDPAEQRRCFHWSNLQPMWWKDNLRKSDWVPDYQI